MAELMQEELLAQLRTRGFEEGFETLPVTEFKGKLDSIGGEMLQTQYGERLRVLYNFTDLTIILSKEPYIYPVLQFSIPHSARKKSGMGILGVSMDSIINAGVPADAPPDQVKGQAWLIGKVLHMKKTGGHMIWDGQSRQEMPRECWELMAVMGESAPSTPTVEVAGVSARTRALELLDGKTENQWHQAVFTDPIIKADGDLVSEITSRKFLVSVEASNKASKDGHGVYHKV